MTREWFVGTPRDPLVTFCHLDFPGSCSLSPDCRDGAGHMPSLRRGEAVTSRCQLSATTCSIQKKNNLVCNPFFRVNLDVRSGLCKL